MHSDFSLHATELAVKLLPSCILCKCRGKKIWLHLADTKILTEIWKPHDFAGVNHEHVRIDTPLSADGGQEAYQVFSGEAAKHFERGENCSSQSSKEARQATKAC